MQEAYTYRVVNSPKHYFVYTDESLLGSLQKRSWHPQPVLLEIMGHQYQLETWGLINPVVSITDVDAKTLVGKMKISNFARLFPKVILEYNNTVLSWASKNIFSLHWQWKKDEVIIIEAIEKFEVKERKGVIVLSDYFRDAELLIMLGFYLQNNMKFFSLSSLLNTKAKKKKVRE
jgi:hypothetical protein